MREFFLNAAILISKSQDQEDLMLLSGEAPRINIFCNDDNLAS